MNYPLLIAHREVEYEQSLDALMERARGKYIEGRGSPEHTFYRYQKIKKINRRKYR